MRNPLLGHGEETPIGRDAHDRLRHTQRDGLRVCDPSTSVPAPLGKEIVLRAITAMRRVSRSACTWPPGRRCLWTTADFGLFSKDPLHRGTRRGINHLADDASAETVAIRNKLRVHPAGGRPGPNPRGALAPHPPPTATSGHPPRPAPRPPGQAPVQVSPLSSSSPSSARECPQPATGPRGPLRGAGTAPGAMTG